MLISSEYPTEIIDLAHCPDFALGSMRVRPSSREVERDGKREVLEPRVMQVLVALAEGGGAVVSREDLVRRCWEGRSVGDDAINRCVAKIRRLSEGNTRRVFTVDTVPRVGYRLLVVESTAVPPPIQSALTAVPAISRPVRARPGAGALRLRALSLGAGIVAIAAVAALAFASFFPKHWVVDSDRAVVATPLIERHPAISPDGTMLAYAAGKDVFTRQIYLRRLAGGDAIQLTSDAYDHAAPNWSRDGNRLVYVASKKGEPCHIIVAPVPAGLAREVARCISAERSRADWDISGQSLYYSDGRSQNGQQKIYRLEIATGTRSELTNPPSDVIVEEEPAVSPDGRFVGFLRARNEADVALVAHDLSNGAETTLYRGLAGFFPSWAWAENSRDIFLSDLRNLVLRRHSAGGGDEDIFRTPLMISRLAPGPNGLLAAEMDSYRSNLATSPMTPGGEPVFIDPADNITSSLSFAPDGTLAMVSNRTGEFAVWMIAPGKPASQLVSFGQSRLSSVSFSPDGLRLAAAVELQGGAAIRILSRGGTELASIPLPSGIGEPQWLPDGKSLVFPVMDAKGTRIVRLDLANPGALTPITGDGWGMVRVHGGELFGSRTDQAGVWLLGKTPRLISAKPPLLHRAQWKIQGDDILYVAGDNREHLLLVAQPIAGGPEHVVAEVPRFGDDGVNGETGEFAINPKTGQIVYTSAVQVDSDIHLLHVVRR